VGDLRKDPTRGQWVLVRPREDIAHSEGECPFCPGNEALTPSEIAAYRKEGSLPGGPDWDVRVVPERDPYFKVEWDLLREGVGMYDKVTPRGASELIIESPGHDHTLATMGDEQIERVLWMYRDRLEDLKRDTRIRDILITRRHRKPDARLTHPYSRVIAIPIIFDDIRRELQESREYYQYKHRCLYCDIVRQEIAVEKRVVRVTPHFLVVVPYAARSPLETWILPRQHHCAFEAITPEAAANLASVMGGYFRTLVDQLDDPSYEMTLHTAPNLQSKILQGDWETIGDDYHWHVEVVIQPERANRVGGIFVNELPPEDAARRLRDAWL
jgi:UDPglucose--hexose-1-phosphate uridylyltransferase